MDAEKSVNPTCESGCSDVEVENDSVFADTPQPISDSITCPASKLQTIQSTSISQPLTVAIKPEVLQHNMGRIIATSNESPRIVLQGGHSIENICSVKTSTGQSPVQLSSILMQTKSLEPKTYTPMRVTGNIYHVTGNITDGSTIRISDQSASTSNPRLADARIKEDLAVYCNSTSNRNGTNTAILKKSLFGSGSKGMCILFKGEMLTPRQFEIACGLEKSRDWRRTIHYQGDTLKTLIQHNILKPHAQSCACRICTNTVTEAAIKYEDEVRHQNQNRRMQKMTRTIIPDSSRPPKKYRKDVFFPQAEIGGPTASSQSKIINATEQLNNALSSRISPDERNQLKSVLERYAQSRDSSLTRLNEFKDEIQKCQRQLNLLKENVIIEQRAVNERETELINVLNTIAAGLDQTPRPSILDQPLSSNLVTQVSSFPDSQKFISRRTTIPSSKEPVTKLHEPRSAPPESPVRVKESLDRRRISSDNVVPRSSSTTQPCSNNGCDQMAAFMCQGCNSAIYCGKNCQEEAWNNGHDAVCGEEVPTN